jgi:hypothetical protein
MIGAAAGYVLGTRAGHEQYERMSRAARKAWNSEPAERLREEISMNMPSRVTSMMGRIGEMRHPEDDMVSRASRLPA